MKLLIYIYISIFSIFSFSETSDIEKYITSAFKKGDAKTISRYFTSSVKVSIERNEQIASKSQAEIIVSDYLNDNKLLEVEHRQYSKDSNTNFLLFEAKSNKKDIKIFIKLVKIRDSEYISELRIE
ncbi:DUF4783 domain-containing protein [Sphingobacterium bovistauri]|uniref:DUF4783 domain-containing protein n=1 Tax=Sphingobacterium bovistauri TaxID=2781959 RepID=A0ABS7Z261_9SPHI|nr:DUF4783 domain-containing protein [Sphingobacterium bovistauri]MCA5003677.1 DUF4783 domain-containing protein [Sphingobacterium bovistauri]